MKKKLTTLMFLIIFLVSSSIQTNSNVVQIEADDSYAPWHFIAFGDSRNWDENITNEIRKSVFEDVMLSNPNLEFILHSGDMAYNGGEQDDWNRYYEDIDLLVQNDIQFYYAVGNHEMYTYRFPNGTYGPLDMDFSTYMANVEMPGNERFYSFDFNQIHFIIINTEEYWTHPDDYEYEITPEQYSWIIDDLESNNKSFTIAMFHRPSYSVRSESRNQDSRVIRAVLEPILIDYG
ncbi:MAG: hypothetical protein GOP50_05870, partial [Candidatus Heimdallarchaeota archaeon]|nr:hypothetical protein [Candidatus Heimdallarchaeota archaeon]